MSFVCALTNLAIPAVGFLLFNKQNWRFLLFGHCSIRFRHLWPLPLPQCLATNMTISLRRRSLKRRVTTPTACLKRWIAWPVNFPWRMTSPAPWRTDGRCLSGVAMTTLEWVVTQESCRPLCENFEVVFFTKKWMLLAVRRSNTTENLLFSYRGVIYTRILYFCF